MEPAAPAWIIEAYGARKISKMYVNRAPSADETADVDPIEMMVGRRTARRLTVELPAQLHCNEHHRNVVVQDVSMTGARLKLSVPPYPGTEVLLFWDDMVCNCRVKWSTADSCGVQFSESGDVN